MNASEIATQKGAAFAAAQVGPLEGLDAYAFPHPALKQDVPGKLFLRELLGLTSMEVSLNKLPPLARLPFYHTHRESEELYLFIKGEGEFRVDGERIPIRPGTAIRVAPQGQRVWRNLSREPLYYIVIQAKAGSFAASTISDGVRLELPVKWR